MPTTLRKSKAKSQARIYEHTENLEPAATKEFVRQELAPVKESVNRLWQVMLGGFALLQSNMNYLHSDTKADMREINKRLDKYREPFTEKTVAYFLTFF